ncbi:MAG TPA: hypothetical protein VE646_11345 [Actinomycetota bacterium]|jgi:hypothetical protein|nr:hypothetical protein [Actinomycetota bacterium]
MRAYCPKTLFLFSSHTAPAEGCSCGIYASKSQPTYDRPDRVRTDYYGKTSLWGVVRLTGKVIEHSGGFRAEYARPVALVMNEDTPLDIVDSYGLLPIGSLTDWKL